MAKPDKIEILLAEYSAAQDSAQHHANLTWVVISIILAGSLAMMGSIVKSIASLDKLSITFLSFLNMFLIFFLVVVVHDFRGIKNQKYDRCKEIEKRIRKEYKDETLMLQHTQTEKGSQGVLFYLTLIFLFIGWLIILLKANNCCFVT